MSHFAVAVFTDGSMTVDELLAPYDEGISVDRYLLYTREQLIKNARAKLEEIRTTRYAEYVKDPAAYLANVCHGNAEGPHYRYISSEFMKCFQETDEQLLKRELEDYADDMKDGDGNVYSTYNPDSKWDWYVDGGRFSGLLIDSENGERADELPAERIDLARMQRISQAEMLPYEQAIANSWYKPEYLKRMYPDAETYEKIQTTFWTRAVVTPDGQWHEVGQMGWFACSSEEPEEIIKWVNAYYGSFLAPAMEHHWDIHIIDCHI